MARRPVLASYRKHRQSGLVPGQVPASKSGVRVSKNICGAAQTKSRREVTNSVALPVISRGLAADLDPYWRD